MVEIEAVAEEQVDQDQEWKSYPLTKLNEILEEAREEKKYLLIQDAQGDVCNFFMYHGRRLNAATSMDKIECGTEPKEEVLEKYRQELIKAMRNGQFIVFDFYKAKPDFKKVLTRLFYKQKMCKHNNDITILKEIVSSQFLFR